MTAMDRIINKHLFRNNTETNVTFVEGEGISISLKKAPDTKKVYARTYSRA